MSDRRILRVAGVDADILRLEHRIRDLEGGVTIAETRDRADATEEIAGELELQLDALGPKERALSSEDETLHRRLEAEQQRMYSGVIVNEKELTALQHEIDTVKGKISALEDEELALMEERERLETALVAARDERDTARGAFETARDGAEVELAEARATLAAKQTDRAAAVEGIDEELLELYEEMRRNKHGVGAAALVDGTCQGCHERLSAMDLDRIKHAEGVVRCPNCRRILVP